METVRRSSYLHDIRTLYDVGSFAGLTDVELLERFAGGVGEAAELAFAALVERHGPMVLRVCRRGPARRARRRGRLPGDVPGPGAQGRLDPQGRVPGELAARGGVPDRGLRRGPPRPGGERMRRTGRPAGDGSPVDGAGELASILHEELGRLPEKYRAPIVLCHLEGLTHEQAARQLRWPVGTVRSRLSRGREALRNRLTRRGVALAAGLWEWARPAETVSAAGCPMLAASVVPAGWGGPLPASVVLLAQGVMKAMLIAKLKSAVLVLGLLLAGAVVVAGRRRSDTARPRRRRRPGRRLTPGPSEIRDLRPTEEEAVTRELDALDLGLLAEEVGQLREVVRLAIEGKIRAEHRIPAGTGEDSGPDEGKMKAARAAYESARAVLPGAGEGAAGETAAAGNGSGTSADRQHPATVSRGPPGQRSARCRARQGGAGLPRPSARSTWTRCSSGLRRQSSGSRATGNGSRSEKRD